MVTVRPAPGTTPGMDTSDASVTEWVVLRPAGDISDSDLPSVLEGEWRERTTLTDQAGIDLDGPEGVVRALPTADIEHSPDGRAARVYRVPADDDKNGDSAID